MISLISNTRPPASVPEQDFDFEVITNPVTINRILNQMHYTNSKISLHVNTDAGGTLTYRSSIARVNRKNGQIVIHQIQPGGWQQAVEPGRQVEVNCFMSSGQMTFFSRLSPLDDSRDNYYCVLSMPKELTKFQLRSAYRVFMPPGTCEIRVSVNDNEGKSATFEGVGLDLSLDGCCLRFIGDVYSLLGEEKMFRGLEFNILSGALRFTTDATISRTSEGPRGQKIAGVKFLPLPEPVKRQLQSALVDIQRLQLRQQVRIY